MNNINGIDGYGGARAIQPQNRQEPKPPPTPVEAGKDSDYVEISSIAQYLQKIALLPEIRAEKVESVRQALVEGSYDIEKKLSAALDKLLDEYVQE